MGSITINSSVTKSYAPDIVNFDIHIVKVASSSKELVAYNKGMIDKLLAGIDELDIDGDNLKETYFRIAVNRENIDGVWKNNGYKLDSEYTIEVYLDYELMDGIRDMLANLDVQYSTNYMLEDESDIRDMLLKEAVEKSRRKASVIASAGGMEVGEMKDVKYNDSSRPMAMYRGAVCDSQNNDVAPKDVEITESVEVEWEIKD